MKFGNRDGCEGGRGKLGGGGKEEMKDGEKGKRGKE